MNNNYNKKKEKVENKVNILLRKIHLKRQTIYLNKFLFFPKIKKKKYK